MSGLMGNGTNDSIPEGSRRGKLECENQPALSRLFFRPIHKSGFTQSSEVDIFRSSNASKKERNSYVGSSEYVFEWTESERAELEFGNQLGHVFAVVTFGIYLRTMHPTVAGGDSGELMGAACELGVAHPPVISTNMKLVSCDSC
jgi:hypothetical protein